MNFRVIKPDDMGTIFDVRIRTWHNPNGAEELTRMGITPESVCELMQTSHRGWLAEQNNRVVGFSMGNKTTGEMWIIAVLPEYENQGVGKRLLQLVEDWLIAEGCTELWLTTDTDETMRCVGFYRHMGWKDWKIADGDRYMKKRIRSSSEPLCHP